MTLTMCRDRCMTFPKEYLERAVNVIEKAFNDDLLWKCATDLTELALIHQYVDVAERLNKVRAGLCHR